MDRNQHVVPRSTNHRPIDRSPRPASTPARGPLVAALGALALAGAYAPSAHAQVEARCPTGFTVIAPIAQASEGQRPALACARPPVQLGALEVDRTFEADSQEELGLVYQLVNRLGFPQPQPGLLRAETVGGVSARIAELHGQGQSPEGATTEVEAVVALVRIGQRTLVLRGLSTDGARAHVRPAVMAALPTFVGLDGAPPQWRATATCPPGTSPAQEGPPGNGLRRVAVCATSDERRRVEVLESRLPVRNAAEAHAEAEHYQAIVQRTLAQLGGRVVVDPTQPFTAGTVRGFSTALHATASPPQGVPGVPPGGIRLEMVVATIPSPSGHVQIAITADGAAPAEVLQAAQAVAQGHVHTDGPVLPSEPVVPAEPVGGASSGPSATGPSDPNRPSAPPRPRQRQIDPNTPLWNPGEEAPLRASDPNANRPQRGACGCAVPGGDGATAPRGALLLGLVAGGMVTLQRARRRRR